MSSPTATATAPATGSTTAAPPPPPAYPPGLAVDHTQDDVSFQTNIIVCSVVTWLGALVSVAARVYTRRLLLRVWSWEDWIIVVSLLFSALCSASIVIQAHFGLGTHFWTVPPQQLEALAQAGWFDLLFYYLSLWSTKISILLLYRRILAYSWAKTLTYALFALTVLSGVWTVASVLTACVPLNAFWDRNVQGVCHEVKWWASTTITHIVIDFLIYLLPTPVIRSLRLRRPLKMLLYFLFAFGFLLCLISVLRMLNLISVEHSVDFTWDYTTSAYWTTIETNFSIICACVMTLKPLIAKLLPDLAQECISSADPDLRGVYSDGRHPPTIGTKPMRTPPGYPDTSLSMFSSINGDTDADGDGAAQGDGRNSHTIPDGSDTELGAVRGRS